MSISTLSVVPLFDKPKPASKVAPQHKPEPLGKPAQPFSADLPEGFAHVMKQCRVRSTGAPKPAETFVAPEGQEGLKLESILGYSGSSGHDNLVWHPDSGFFAYCSGVSVITEDLTASGAPLPFSGNADFELSAHIAW